MKLNLTVTEPNTTNNKDLKTQIRKINISKQNPGFITLWQMSRNERMNAGNLRTGVNRWEIPGVVVTGVVVVVESVVSDSDVHTRTHARTHTHTNKSIRVSWHLQIEGLADFAGARFLLPTYPWCPCSRLFRPRQRLKCWPGDRLIRKFWPANRSGHQTSGP